LRFGRLRLSLCLSKTMYIPPLNAITDNAVIYDFVRQHDFATLITADADGVPFASHIPLTLLQKPDGTCILHGHLARANTHWKLLEQGRSTLAIFHGPHTYISPRWYNHENVPTWNYEVVHAYCKPRIFTDLKALQENVTHLTELYEHETGYSVGGLSPKLLGAELRGIVGIELAVERFEAKFKLSQNRDAESHANIINELRASGNEHGMAIAAAMELHTPHITSLQTNSLKKDIPKI